jgi:hypothetical protein
MRNFIATLCCIIFIQNNNYAQSILSLETATINSTTVVLPTYDNLFKLLKASKSDFLATMSGLHYKQSKPDDPNTFEASNTEQVYNIDKEDGNADIFFSDNESYPKKVMNDFLTRYPNARHKSMSGGIEAYYFDVKGIGGTINHYCMFFDLPKDGGGGITLLVLN